MYEYLIRYEGKMAKNDLDKQLSKKYCKRFGMIAIEMEFIAEKQLKQAMIKQLDDNLNNRPHKMIGEILFENNWITEEQINLVLNKLFP